MYSYKLQRPIKTRFYSDNAISSPTYDDTYCLSSECICGDEGVYYICPACGRKYFDELDATICCLPDCNV